jgi:hypothetical protein
MGGSLSRNLTADKCVPKPHSALDHDHAKPIPHDEGSKLLITSLVSGLGTMIAIYIAGGLSRSELSLCLGA